MTEKLHKSKVSYNNQVCATKWKNRPYLSYLLRDRYNIIKMSSIQLSVHAVYFIPLNQKLRLLKYWYT